MIHLVVLDSEFALSPSWTARYCLSAMLAAVYFRSIAIGLMEIFSVVHLMQRSR